MSLETPRNLRHALKSIVPNWLADRPSLRVGFTVLYVIALMADLFIEATFQGVFAAWPGKGTPSALEYIGRGRSLIHGYLESDEDYATRLRAAFDTWPEAASPRRLGQIVQEYLGNNLVVRVVERRHSTSVTRFTTINADGSVDVEDDGDWNWDETQFPERVDSWSDTWVIVYNTDGRWPTYTNLSDTDFVSAFGTVDGGGIGHEVPRSVVSDLRVILSVFKGAHSKILSLIFTEDTGLFDPGALGGIPNGWYANWGRLFGSAQEFIPSRLIADGTRYWTIDGG